MKTTLASAVSSLSLTTACGMAQVLTVVPTHLAATEGNSSSSSLSQTGAASLQLYYTEAFLASAGITPGVTITGFAYRRNAAGGVTGPPADTTYSEFNVFLSQSHADPTSWSTTFASNVVGAQTQVFGAPFTIPALGMPGGASPNAFGPIVPFSTNYPYTGGSLLVEIRRGARTGDTTSMNTDADNTATTTPGCRWLFNTSSSTALTGTQIVGGHPIQLRYTTGGPACYANCDESTTVPALNVADFTCFLTKFAASDPYANCDESTAAPTLNVADFTCFLTKYAAGCP